MPPRIKAAHEALAPVRKRSRGAIIALGALGLLAVLALGVLLRGRPPAPVSASSARAPSDPHFASEMPALLAGLAIGDSIGDWRVQSVHVHDRKLGVDLVQNDLMMTVWIAKKGAHPMLPPRQTERYAIYFGFPAESQPAVSRDLDLILGEFEKRLRRSETSSPVPAGL